MKSFLKKVIISLILGFALVQIGENLNSQLRIQNQYVASEDIDPGPANLF